MTFIRPSGTRYLLILLFLAGPAAAGAQTAQTAHTPRAGGLSAWGTGGFASPSEGAFDSGLGLSGGIDYFLSRALSVGVTAGGWRTSTSLGSHANEVYFDAAATYNWEMGTFHPFVQGGLGLYRQISRRGPHRRSSEASAAGASTSSSLGTGPWRAPCAITSRRARRAWKGTFSRRWPASSSISSRVPA